MIGIKNSQQRHRAAVFLLVGIVVGFLVTGCATRVDWKSRVGSYTYDDAIKELGPPDKVATTSDQTTVAEWLLYHGDSYATYTSFGPRGFRGYHSGFYTVDVVDGPARFLRLTFNPDHRLLSAREFYK